MADEPGAIEKYRELYTLSKEVLAQETARFSRLDRKASTYLAALTLAFSIYGLMASSFLGGLPARRTLVEWSLLALVIAIPGFFLWAWLEVFAVLKVQGTRRPPLGDGMLRFFDEHRLIDIYYTLAKGNSAALDENQAVADHKSRRLQAAYQRIRLAVLALVVFLLLFGLQRLLRRV
jgi:hypothetical protein